MKIKIVFVCLLCSLAAVRLPAQVVSGTILGSVKDSTGAALTGAVVRISGAENGITRTVSSDDAGEYTMPSIPPGAYNASVERAGFKKASLKDLQLAVDQKLRVDLAL